MSKLRHRVVKKLAPDLTGLVSGVVEFACTQSN